MLQPALAAGFFIPMPQDLIDRLDALIASQAALAESIGSLAHSLAILAAAMTDDEPAAATSPATLDG